MKKKTVKKERALTMIERDQCLVSVTLSLEAIAASLSVVSDVNLKSLAIISTMVNSPAVFMVANTIEGEAREHFLKMREQIVTILNSK